MCEDATSDAHTKRCLPADPKPSSHRTSLRIAKAKTAPLVHPLHRRLSRLFINDHEHLPHQKVDTALEARLQESAKRHRSQVHPKVPHRKRPERERRLPRKCPSESSECSTSNRRILTISPKGKRGGPSTPTERSKKGDNCKLACLLSRHYETDFSLETPYWRSDGR